MQLIKHTACEVHLGVQEAANEHVVMHSVQDQFVVAKITQRPVQLLRLCLHILLYHVLQGYSSAIEILIGQKGKCLLFLAGQY